MGIKNKILIFGGTTEGRKLCEELNRRRIYSDVSVTTEYGGDLIWNLEYCDIFVQRLNFDEMRSFIIERGYNVIVDCTHPYAVIVTENIKKVCESLNIEYIRLLREESFDKGAIVCDSTKDAVEFIKGVKGNVLSTIGSKELHLFKEIEEYEKRIFARVLPMVSVMEECVRLGFKGRNIICMQGPFSESLNAALLKEFDCKYLLTKSSGDIGGVAEKISAAKMVSAEVILIKRPTDEVGIGFSEVLDRITNILSFDISSKL